MKKFLNPVISFFKRKKVKLITYAVMYVALTAVIIVSSVSIFNHYYYEIVYVSGDSMNPTLSGTPGEMNYGKSDRSYNAIKNLKRFQIVTTYYPGDIPNESVYKIKRVIVLPGETYKVENNEIYIYNHTTNSWGEPLVKNYTPNLPYGANSPYSSGTLKDNEYFVAGDNGPNSKDSFDIGPIDIKCIAGVITSIEGTCDVDEERRVMISCTPYATPLYFLGVDY